MSNADPTRSRQYGGLTRGLVVAIAALGLALVLQSPAEATIWQRPPICYYYSTSNTKAAVNCNPVLDGSFLQGSAPVDWTSSQFSSELSNMVAVKTHTLLLQWSINEANNAAYYPTSIPGYKQVTSNGAAVDVVGNTLAQAKAQGMGVYVGLQIDEANWFANGADASYLNAQVPLAERLADDLWARYGSYASTVKGWYLPFEVTNYQFTSASAQANLTSFFQTVVGYLHSHDGNLPVVTSPFYYDGVGLTPSGWTSMWTTILKAAPFDVLAVQDGVGDNHVTLASPSATASTLQAWFAATKAAITSSGATTALWHNADMYGVDGWPLGTQQLVADIKAVSQYVSKVVGFSFSSQISPMHWGGSTLFYSPYQTYVQTGRVPSGAPTPPASLTATSPQALTASLTWNSSTSVSGAGIAGYRISRASAGSASFTLVSTLHGSSMLSFSDPQLTVGVAYTYHVTGYDAAGNESPPAAASVTISGATYYHDAALNRPYSWTPGFAQPDPAVNSLYVDIGTQHKLTDGVLGSTDPQDGNWIGFQSTSAADLVVSFASPQTVHQVTTDWLQQKSWGIALPAQVEYYYLNSGQWVLLATVTQPNLDHNTVTKQTYTATNLNIVTTQIAVKAYAFSPGTPPNWTPWNFIDEVQVFDQ